MQVLAIYQNVYFNMMIRVLILNMKSFSLIIIGTVRAYELFTPVDNAVGTGFDVSSLMSVSAGTCLKNAGYNTVIARGFQSTGNIDTHVCSTLMNAKTAGIENREVYMFPCPTCSTDVST